MVDMNIKKTNENAFAYILFFCANIMQIPLLSAFNISAKLMFVFLLGIFIIYYLMRKMNVKILRNDILWLILICLLLAFVKGIEANSLSIALSFYFCFFIFFTFSTVDYEKSINKFIDLSTSFFFVLGIGGIIGLAYAQNGGQPLFSIPNPDTRLNYFYLTTFTNARLGRFIRPSGIYDEPGALSFFICAIVVLRTLYKRNNLTSLLLLVIGCCTLSLTHILFTLIYLFYFLITNKNKRQNFLILLCLFVILSFFVIKFYDLIETLFLSRFERNSTTGKLAGDNRSGQIEACLKYMNLKTFFWGLDDSLYTNYEFFHKKYGTLAENILGPLTLRGILISFIYYLFLAILLFAGIFCKNKIMALEIFLLWFQRPYANLTGYVVYFYFFFAFYSNELKYSKKIKYILGLGSRNFSNNIPKKS